LSICDIRTLRIPNRATALFLLWESLCIAAKEEFPSGSLGLSLLTALLWGVLALSLGMGGGDFKLLFPLALLLRSPAHLFYMLSLAATLGGLFSLAKRYRLTKALPFAPFLAGSALIVLFF
ncbi:MAG: hypothetical protein F2946_06355, partial [Actinobacteria bacterium]|nr:hypothetical protein [Actinomycetota bacterium]